MPATLKVLLVGDFPPPQGGVAVHVEELQRAIRAASGEAVVLDIGKGQLPADKVVAAGGHARFAAQLALHAARGFRIHLHTSGANPKSWLLASLCAAAGQAAGAPALITLHSGLAPEYLAGSPLRRAIAGAVLQRFSAVVAVSHAIARMLRICGVPGSRISVLPAFSHAHLSPGQPPSGFAELRREADPLLCAMLAPEPLYGADELLQAFSRVHETVAAARLALYGPGTASAAMSARARDLCGPAASSLRAFGELSRPQALALIGGSDLFIRPTLADGDSVSVREALALGRRVVATSVGNRPEGILLVPPGDPAALAAGIREALAGPPAAGASSGVDALQRLFSLYQGDGGGRCAASAAS